MSTLYSMQHKGEIIEKAVRSSGYSITKLADSLGRSRRWIYQIFESPNVPIDYILDIGRVIHHDFSDEVRELKVYRIKMSNESAQEPPQGFDSYKTEAEYWKNKYLTVLENYNELLLKKYD